MNEFSKEAWGQMIKAARESAGLSQNDIAEAAGVSHSLPGAWERGRSAPSLEALRLLATALGLTGDQILMLTDTREPTPNVLDAEVDDESDPGEQPVDREQLSVDLTAKLDDLEWLIGRNMAGRDRDEAMGVVEWIRDALGLESEDVDEAA